MNEKQNSAPTAANVSSTELKVTLSNTRWTGRGRHPRLISFSWAAVSPMYTRR